jgi:histone H1/5
MFKAIREFFLGKPAQAPEVVVPYKVEPAPAPVEFTPPPKAADVVVEAPAMVAAAVVAESIPAIVKVETVEAKPAPAKKPAARRKPAPKKPVAKRATVKKPVAK